MKRPIIPSMGHISTIAEGQLFHCLRTKGGQLNTDAGLLFHAFYIVAARAAILTNQRFTAFYIVGIGKFFFDRRDGFAFRAQGRQVRRDRSRFLIAEPQAGHLRLRLKTTGIFNPMENPLRPGLGSDVLEVGYKILSFTERGAELAFGKAVAAFATDGFHQLLAPSGLIVISLANTRRKVIFLEPRFTLFLGL